MKDFFKKFKNEENVFKKALGKFQKKNKSQSTEKQSLTKNEDSFTPKTSPINNENTTPNPIPKQKKPDIFSRRNSALTPDTIQHDSRSTEWLENDLENSNTHLPLDSISDDDSQASTETTILHNSESDPDDYGQFDDPNTPNTVTDTYVSGDTNTHNSFPDIDLIKNNNLVATEPTKFLHKISNYLSSNIILYHLKIVEITTNSVDLYYQPIPSKANLVAYNIVALRIIRKGPDKRAFGLNLLLGTLRAYSEGWEKAAQQMLIALLYMAISKNVYISSIMKLYSVYSIIKNIYQLYINYHDDYYKWKSYKIWSLLTSNYCGTYCENFTQKYQQQADKQEAKITQNYSSACKLKAVIIQHKMISKFGEKAGKDLWQCVEPLMHQKCQSNIGIMFEHEGQEQYKTNIENDLATCNATAISEIIIPEYQDF